MTSLSRKRALQDLATQRKKNNLSNFPSLFDIAIQTCISHLEIYGTFDGLPFHPFGQPLFEEFVKRAGQWRLTTEQRQAGIILFSESYGEGFLGPEYTGIRCSLQDDIPHLGAFAECLVYLDLSGGCVAGNSPGLEDKDMAFLSGLSRLKILNLAGLKIGDTGLSHLVRSVTFGSSGPALLEYLNLAGTDVSHRGIARLWSSQQQQQQHRSQRQLVFQRLLGIDLSGTAVLPSVAETLFQEQILAPEEGGWTRLGRSVELFPSQTLQEQQSATYANYPSSYHEQENGINPMQKWVDRLNRTYKLTFGQKPDLGGEDGLGLSECLALSKLDQVHFIPLSEPLAPHQVEYNRRGEEMRRTFAEERENRRRSKKRTKYSRDQEVDGDIRTTMSAGSGRSFIKQQNAAASLVNSDKNAIIGENGLDHMFNLNMYQKVLSYVRLTFGTRTRSIASNGKSSGQHEGLAFVRVRSVVEKRLTFLEVRDVEMEAPQFASQQQKRQGDASQGWSTGMGPHGVVVSTIARLKPRYRPPLIESDETDYHDSALQSSFLDRPTKQEDVKYEPRDDLQDDVKIEPRYRLKESHKRNVYKQEDQRHDLQQAPKVTLVNPFAKAATSPASRTSSWVFSTSTSPRKQEPIPLQHPQGPPIGNLPTRRRAGQDIGNSYQFQPFIKPATEQSSSSIFITQPSPRKEQHLQQKQGGRSVSKPITMVKTRADKKPVVTPRTTFFPMRSGIGGGVDGAGGGSSMMQRWTQQEQQPQMKPAPLPSPSPVKKSPSKPSTGAGSQDKKAAATATATQPSVIREFQFKDIKRDTVNLDRWIRTGGSGVTGSKTNGGTLASNSLSTERSNLFNATVTKAAKEPIKTIRFDPRDELFADPEGDDDGSG
ncbi:hypothetical protein BG015_011676 [Linnemannia schmuckeri]|uniref:Leucine rich repeat protein n=1 Tax=Linnemannia schmuckeri TaxID=64567 RepID=A0A9P5S4T3_9FUNG|nr:hypothetical protein BG015_011676 [Linnemannia schmuckeri]